MPILIRELPPLLEAFFVEEARGVPTAFIMSANPTAGYLGPKIRQLSGPPITAGWALPVKCPPGDNLVTYLAIEYLRKHSGHGRWIIVISHEKDEEPSCAALWDHIQSVMGWEIGVVGAVINGFVKDIDEIRQKLEKEFGVFAIGASPVKPTWSPSGTIGLPVSINNVTIHTGDLIVGDADGVVCIPKDEVERTINDSRQAIVDGVNLLQYVREGHGPIELLNLEQFLENNIEWED